MLRALDVLSRTALAALGAVVLASMILLAQSPFWMDSVPWAFKLAVVSVAVLAFVRPHDGLLVVAGLSTLGLVAGRLLDSPARGSEALVLAFLAGWLLRTRDRSRSGGSLSLPVVLFGLVILASLVEQIWFLQIQTNFPGPFLQGLWRYASRDYLRGSMMGFGMVRAAALLIEGLGLCMAVVALSRTDAGLVPRLVRMVLAGAVGGALMNVLYAVTEVIGSGDWSSELVNALLYRRWTYHVGDVNAAGSYFALTLPLAVGAATACRGGERVWLALGGGVIGLAFWMTGARAAQAGLLVVLFLLVVSRIVCTRSPRERSLMIGAAAIVPVAAIVGMLWLSGGGARVMPERGLVQMTAGAAVQDRLLFTQGSLAMWAFRPVFGVGVGQYYLWSARFFSPALRAIHPRENAHNYVLQIAAELGAVGLVLFLWVLGAAARPLWTSVVQPSADPVRLGLAAGLGAFMVSALAGQPFLVPPVVYSFWLLVGVAAASDTRGRSVAPAQGHQDALTDPNHQTAWGTLTVGFRGRVVVVGLTVVLGVSMSTRVASQVGAIDITKVEYGLYLSETEPDGTPFRWTGGRARLFVPATATDITLPLRAILVGANREGMTVVVSFDGRWSLAVELEDGEWHMHRVRLPPTRAGARYRTVELRVERPWRPSDAIPGNADPRELGVKLGEVGVALGRTALP